ncbi:hypothetical protein V6N12_045656 [Hibiscus sabdariffa]|uniref:Secreted protein n=1 Tax=Hibiscus sabdariffa TaxID=183260 RepID=A0ABR2G3D6_9ROSI
MTFSVVWSLPPFGGGTVMYCSKSAWPPIGFCSWRFPWHRVVCASPHHHGLGHFWSFLRLVHPLIWMHFVPPLGSKDRLAFAFVRRRHACAYVHLE